ncbi:hypothetical protein [Polaromonas sp.]|uniref:hypothetical protein n=1 Tax=Polaromonas sp. TaxID=1869339 RepID=UPI003264291E
MRKIIDSNRLRSDELRSFLAASSRNIAVLTDFVGMEAYKADSLSTLYKSMEVLATFPRQVQILKGTAKVCAMSGRAAGLQRRLIDEDQTSGFPDFVKHLELARLGNEHLEKQLLENVESARGHLDVQMLGDAATLGATFDTLAMEYSKEERAILRRGDPYTPSMIRRLMETLLQLSVQSFRVAPGGLRMPIRGELPNTFIFRVSLCTYLLALRGGVAGGLTNSAPAKIRNHMVDMVLAAYATFFDGLLSADTMLNDVHTEARMMLGYCFNADVPGIQK